MHEVMFKGRLSQLFRSLKTGCAFLILLLIIVHAR